MADLIWTLVGFTLTLLIFSYLFGDQPLFRVTTYLFIGVAAGYAAVLILYQIILGRLVYPLMEGSLITLAPLLLSLLLLLKLSLHALVIPITYHPILLSVPQVPYGVIRLPDFIRITSAEHSDCKMEILLPVKQRITENCGKLHHRELSTGVIL